MKAHLLALVVFLGMVSVPAMAQVEEFHMDGNSWTQLAPAEKVAFVAGFGVGAEFGKVFALRNVKLPADEVCVDKIEDAINTATDKYLASVTFAQEVDGLNAFYTDYKNRRVGIEDALRVVLEGISGTSQADLDKMTESYRRKAAH